MDRSKVEAWLKGQMKVNTYGEVPLLEGVQTGMRYTFGTLMLRTLWNRAVCPLTGAKKMSLLRAGSTFYGVQHLCRLITEGVDRQALLSTRRQKEAVAKLAEKTAELALQQGKPKTPGERMNEFSKAMAESDFQTVMEQAIAEAKQRKGGIS